MYFHYLLINCFELETKIVPVWKFLLKVLWTCGNGFVSPSVKLYTVGSHLRM